MRTPLLFGILGPLLACTIPELPTETVTQGVTSCPGAVVEGIDVSSYQPDTDWNQVHQSGREFAWVKATEGTGYTNPYFAHDWAAIKAAGMLRSAYQYFRPSVDPIAQAEFFVQVMGPLAPDDLAPMLDLEETDGESAAVVLGRAHAFLDRVKQLTGRDAILYTYPDFWLNQLGDPPGFGQYALNMASYGPCPPLPSSWSHMTFWQYSATGTVPGVQGTGNVDMDRFYGTLDDLRHLGGGPTVVGAILVEYTALGGPSGFLGSPITDELPTPDGVGRFNHFEHGSIYWTPATGAHEVHGAIGDEWTALGWETSVLGYPTTDELPAPDGVGRFNHFERGSIYWTPATGAHEVHGAIRDKWTALGWETSVLGYPLTDEQPAPDGIGRFNHFERGSIYWRPDLGAHEVHGKIYDEWATRGWERSALGYPVSDEYAVPEGRRSDFEHGSLVFDAHSGAVSEPGDPGQPPDSGSPMGEPHQGGCRATTGAGASPVLMALMALVMRARSRRKADARSTRA
jgi:GH25 family lysozyme M1 (1,4-beta-N-acetylmuramidase)